MSNASSQEIAVSPRDELRWKLAAIASQHGIALVSRRDHWDACERALRDAYPERAREIHAAVAALRCGIVADLVAWRADGATRVERELTARLVERTSTDPELARWAIDAWAFAFKIPLDGDAPDPDEYREWRGDARDLVIRARHVVLLGAFAGIAVAASVLSAGASRFHGAALDSAAARPAPPRRAPRAMVQRGDDRGGPGRGSTEDVRRDDQRSAATRLAGGAGPRDSSRSAARHKGSQVSLGDIVARMPKAARVSSSRREKRASPKPAPPARVAQKPKGTRTKELEKIRRAFAVAQRDSARSPRARAGTSSNPPAKSSGAVQAGMPSPAEEACTTRRPRLIRDYEPMLPSELQDRGVSSGRVVLRFRVDDGGLPESGSARVLESSHPLLVERAIDALDRLRYEPAPGGCTSPVTMERTIRFF